MVLTPAQQILAALRADWAARHGYTLPMATGRQYELWAETEAEIARRDLIAEDDDA